MRLPPSISLGCSRRSRPTEGILTEGDEREERMEFSPEIRRFYEEASEAERLQTGPFQLEFERTKQLLSEKLPPPATVLDVGGGPGAYAVWLSALGYEVHLVDP